MRIYSLHISFNDAIGLSFSQVLLEIITEDRQLLWKTDEPINEGISGKCRPAITAIAQFHNLCDLYFAEKSDPESGEQENENGFTMSFLEISTSSQFSTRTTSASNLARLK